MAEVRVAVTREVPDPCRPPCGFEHVEVVGYRSLGGVGAFFRRNVDRILWAEFVICPVLDAVTFLGLREGEESNPFVVHLIGLGGVPLAIAAKVAVYAFGALVARMQSEPWARRLVLTAGALVGLLGAASNLLVWTSR